MKHILLLLLSKAKTTLVFSSLLFLTLFLLGISTHTANAQAFRTTWRPNSNTLTIPIIGTKSYNMTWTNLTAPGAGNGFATGLTNPYTITGLTSGNTYEIAITAPSLSGTIHFDMSFNPGRGRENLKLQTIEEWGDIVWTSMNKAFYECSYLTYNATDIPNLSAVTDMSFMFYRCGNFNGNNTINNWNTATVRDMNNMFRGGVSFNGNIGNWNTMAVTNMSGMFESALAFNQDIGNWNTAAVTNMSGMFESATAFNQDIGNWNTAAVTNMSGMFASTSHFNQDIGNWNTAAVTNMSEMFRAAFFNQDIGNWNTGAVTNMGEMFRDAFFNQDIGNWNTATVGNMSGMFFGASSFNQDIGRWNTAAVGDMSRMFRAATAFNQDISEWNTAAVTNMSGMFYSATAFNQDISEWNTAAVWSMSQMFRDARAFNRNISPWNTANVTSMWEMFRGATAFNQNIGGWNTANVTTMSYMFDGASSFNQDIGNWNTVAVTDMSYMFAFASSFNQDIGNWNTLAVRDMGRMFFDASSFNQDIGNWKPIYNVQHMLSYCGMNTANYDATLIGWAAQTVNSGVPLGATGLKYCNAVAARAILTSAPNNWNITGDALLCSFSPPEINLQGNGSNIVSGTSITNLTNDTYFGSVLTCNTNTISKTFTIQNIGLGALSITGITISGTNASDFSLGTLPTTVAANGSATFTVTFNPSAIGNRVATLNIANDDSDENPYTFAINGNGLADTQTLVAPTLAAINSQCSVSSITVPTIDNCSGTITGTTTQTFPITAQGITVVTWTFRDATGNSVTANQNVIITADTQNPVIPTLADVTSSCSVASLVTPTTTDNCGTITGTTTQIFPITATTVVTWTFTDAAGNFVTATQNIIVNDNVNPVIPTLANVTAQCSITSLVAPTTTDNCSGTITGTTTQTLPITTTTVVTWTFTDAIGNFVTATQNVVITADTQNPTIPTLADVRAGCSVASLVAPTTTDNCSTITGTTTQIFPITAQGTTVVTWTFTDAAGNFVTANQNVIVASCGSSAFRTTWIPTSNTLTIPIIGTKIYNITWTNLTTAGLGNGSATARTGSYTINGLTSGNTYEIAITVTSPTGTFHFIIANGVERFKLRTIESWGPTVWTSMNRAFEGCSNLTYNATDIPNLSAVTNLGGMFQQCTRFNGNIGNWNTATITDMSLMFAFCGSFNQDIGNWNTAAVTDMSEMFYQATVFNQNIGNWNTAAVTDMSGMFKNAFVFNQDIGNWNTATVNYMEQMFEAAWVFNQDIGNWNTAAVGNMHSMFRYALTFNQDIGNWNTVSVHNMAYMFDANPVFNQDISGWSTDRVSNMTYMFADASAFNQDIGGWNTLRVRDMSNMFSGASAFNQNIGNWNTAEVRDMNNMFSGASAFNQNIGSWNTAIVTRMNDMFSSATAFNQDIGNWNTATVIDMSNMFSQASAFNQNISGWNITSVVHNPFTLPNISYSMEGMLNNCGMNTVNYDAALIGWAAQSTQGYTRLGAVGRTYCNAVAARGTLTSNLQRWVITGDALLCSASSEINLQGNGNNIVSGTNTTSPTNNTDFGSILACNTNTITKTFTIQNTGIEVLTITGITIGGTNATDFSLGTLPTSVAANGSATFTVTFNPSAIGNRVATLNIANNDSDENPYIFAINGHGTADTQNPVIPTLADITAACSVYFLFAPATTDNCSGTITGTTTQTLPITATTVITWTFTDAAGNFVTANQNIIITDIQNPVTPTNLADITAACSVTSLVAPTTTDNCSGTIIGTTTQMLPITATTVVIWTFTDAVGNFVTANQNVIINDNVNPTIPTLADLTAACSVASLVAPTTIDNCSTITGTTTQVFPITTTTVVTWTFTDAAGNFVTATQNVVISPDTQNPTIPTLADVTAGCSVASLVAPTTTDNCSTVTGTTTQTFPITATTVVTWTFTDAAGNFVTANQNVIITTDTQNPIIPTLADVTAQCSVASLVAPTTTDNCSGTITGTTTQTFPITAQGTTVVEWTFTDAAGNFVTANQNVVITDTQNPVIPTLADITAACSVTSLVAPTTTDNCSGTITGITTQTFPITTTTVVTWTFTDAAGNFVTATQNVIINDNVNPVTPATLADITAACSVTSLVAPTTTDNCSGTITGITTQTLPITATTVVTWTFTDAAGNFVTANQNVIITDTQNPVIPTLADITTQCPVVSFVPTTTDNCSGTITGTTTQTFPITTTTVVTWTFTDAAGNFVTTTQNVNVTADVTSPIIPTLADITTQCPILSLVIPTTTDNCAGTITGTTSQSLPITTQGTTIVTWTFDDGNGNVVTANQNVVINADTTNPTITAPTNVTANADTGLCSASNVILGTPTGTDNCGTVTFTSNAPTIFPAGSTNVVWTVNDGNGNTSTATQIVTIVTPIEINLKGNSVSIVDGSAVASVSNDTDFGDVLTTKTVIYTIENTGIEPLLISSITSSNPKFVVSNAITSISALSSATFTVEFSSTTLGLETAAIIVNNNDCNEAVYNFAIKATKISTTPPPPPTGGGTGTGGTGTGGTITPPNVVFTGTANPSNSSIVDLSWNTNGSVSEFRLYRNGVLIITFSGSVINFSDANLAANTLYTYELVWVINGVTSAPSVVTFWTAPNPPAVSSVTDVCGQGSATVKLSSTLNGTGNTYRVYAQQTGGSSLFESDTTLFNLPSVNSQTDFYISTVGAVSGKEGERRKVTVRIQPTFEAIIVGESTKNSCTNSVLLQAEQIDNANSYTWILNGNDVGTGQAFRATIEGEYKVRILKINCEVLSEPVQVLLNQTPTAQIQESNAQNTISFCENGNLNAISSGQNATYKWSLNGNVVGEEQNVAVSQSGTYTLLVSKNGCQASKTINVVIAPRPQLPTLSATQDSICLGITTTLSVQNTQNGVSYKWLKNGIATDKTGSSIEVNEAGNYKVEVTSNVENSCTTVSEAFQINSFEVIPTYLRTNEQRGTLYLQTTTQNQLVNIEWYFEGQLKTDLGTTSEIRARQEGNYYAIVTNQKGCSYQTEIVFVPLNVVTGQDDLNNDSFKIYPNPNNGTFKVHFGISLTESVQVTIFDGIGRKIQMTTFEKGNQDFNVHLNNQPKGMYLLHFNQNGATYSKQIVIE